MEKSSLILSYIRFDNIFWRNFKKKRRNIGFRLEWNCIPARKYKCASFICRRLNYRQKTFPFLLVVLFFTYLSVSLEGYWLRFFIFLSVGITHKRCQDFGVLGFWIVITEEMRGQKSRFSSIISFEWPHFLNSALPTYSLSLFNFQLHSRPKNPSKFSQSKISNFTSSYSTLKSVNFNFTSKKHFFHL